MFASGLPFRHRWHRNMWRRVVYPGLTLLKVYDTCQLDDLYMDRHSYCEGA
jgi:hypothetical protein